VHVATSLFVAVSVGLSLLLAGFRRNASTLGRVTEIREIHEDELVRFVAALRAALDEADTVEGYLDWKRQAQETIWLVAAEGERDVGAAIGVGGWHSPEGVARAEVRVVDDARGRGVGSALLAGLSAWGRSLGYVELMGPVKEVDRASLDWAARRGFREVGRNSMLVLDLSAIETPQVVAPDGIELVTWAERPEVAEGMYEVAREAYPDVPGEEDAEMAPFAQWLSMDMEGSGDRPEATFVALAGEEVVAYAKLSLSRARPQVAMHDMTGVKRAWRGRGIAGALKAAEIAWAKENGYERLETQNEERNEPIRRLNQRHGYVVEPGSVTVRGPIG
jgi:mycothiol synthase